MTRQPPIRFPSLLVKFTDNVITADILDEWTWLTGEESRPVLVAACGNVFLEDSRDGTIHLLDVSAARLSPIAETADAFSRMISEQAFADTYLRPERVEKLRQQGMVLDWNEIYSFLQPVSLGGNDSDDNIEIVDVEVHFSITGQIERQIADMPEGASIIGVKTEA